MDERVKRYITGCMILLLISVMSFLPGCGNDADVDVSQTIENAEYNEAGINSKEVDITQKEDKGETQEEDPNDSESIDGDRSFDITPAEVYELFLRGELTAAIKREGEPEEEQLTIDELFWGNDIEYCFLDIDGDGSEELHIRDSIYSDRR